MTDAGVIIGSYAVTIVGIAAYAAWVLRRARRLAGQGFDQADQLILSERLAKEGNSGQLGVRGLKLVGLFGRHERDGQVRPGPPRFGRQIEAVELGHVNVGQDGSDCLWVGAQEQQGSLCARRQLDRVSGVLQ